MALNDKKTGFGFDMEEKFKKVTAKTQTGAEKAEEDEHTHTYTHIYEHIGKGTRSNSGSLVLCLIHFIK